MKAAIAVLALLMLAGCAGWSSLKYGVAKEGAIVADEALDASEWGVCEATTMGAWQRRYGTAPAKADGWRALCGRSVTLPTLP